MNWINIKVATLNSEEFVGAEPDQRATWLCLLKYCCEQENGGVIIASREWKDRKWQQVCAVTRREVLSECDLYWFDGDDLHVFEYPVEKEAEVQAKRNAGAAGGRRSGEARRQAKPKHSFKQNRSTASQQLEANTEKCLNGKEGKEKGKELEGEGKGKEGPASPSPSNENDLTLGFDEQDDPESEEKIDPPGSAPPPLSPILVDVDELREIIGGDRIQMEALAMQTKKPMDYVIGMVSEFVTFLKGQGVKKKMPEDAKSHFANWLRTKNYAAGKENRGSGGASLRPTAHTPEHGKKFGSL